MKKPKHLMLCISGFSGSGKDECASRLVSHHKAVQIGLTDPAKRYMMDLYGFSKEQMFGPSKFRNAGDPRYPKNLCRNLVLHKCDPDQILPDGSAALDHYYFDVDCDQTAIHVASSEDFTLEDLSSLQRSKLGIRGFRYFVKNTNPAFFLSPREVLQKYCELMNSMYLNTWIKKGIEQHKLLAEVIPVICGDEPRLVRKWSYSRSDGITENKTNTFEATINSSYIITCFSDFRHWHEIFTAHAAQSLEMLPIFIRVQRPSIPNPPFNHRSETEQAKIPDLEFDFIVHNDGSVSDLHLKIDKIVESITNKE